ncbi:MAG TPA: glycosyltransferase [Acidobacteriaceae bacterium]|jgi:glycosyltransferase involved in cell wall biosynthesis/peptidoglycan/xylan/chitin deacetylase (PgdA/CDA1 family)
MKFSVLIPTFNRREVLARTLASVFAQEFPASEFEVIVVVDGSNDGTVEMLQGLSPQCGFQFISQANRGLPVARNVALEAAMGEYVLLLDDDIVCEPSLLRKHAEQHDLSENVVVFGSLPLHPDSPDCLVAEQWTTWWTRFQVRLERETGAGPSSEFWVAAGAPAVNRSVSRALLNSLGCCDESMHDCHEDWDLGIRLWKAGIRFHFQADAIAYHLYVKSDRAMVRQDGPLFARGEIALARKHPEYRPVSMLGKMGAGSWRHRMFVAAAVRLPFSVDPILRPLFLVCDALRTRRWFNRAGEHLLSYRSRLEIYREAVRATGSRRALRAEFGMRLPVLGYHHVGTPKPGTYPDLSVTAENFERQVRWLHRKGYRSVSSADWLRWRKDGTGLPEKPVWITFDDAYADIGEHALPVLKRYGFGATVFVVTGHVGGTNAWDEARGSAIHPLMTAEQLRYWAAQGIEFGAHSKTHPELPTVAVEAAAEELSGSRDELAALLGRDVTAFAYPYGRYDLAVRNLASEAFDLAVTTERGLNDLTTDPYLLRRSCVGLRDSVLDLECLLRWGMRPMRALRSKLRLRQRVTRAAALVGGGDRRTAA